MRYFEEEHSVLSRIGDSVNDILELIGNRYTAANPPLPFTFRCFHRGGFLMTADGRCRMDLNERYPQARYGQIVYMYGVATSKEETAADFAINAFGPVRVFVNGKLVFRTVLAEKANERVRHVFSVPLSQGRNGILIEASKAISGFGCVFGTSWAKWVPIDFMQPFTERNGQAGWVYSELVDSPAAADGMVPDPDASEISTGLNWYPTMSWDEKSLAMYSNRRIFGLQQGYAAYAWSRLTCGMSVTQLELAGSTAGPLTIWVDNELVYSGVNEGEFRFQVSLRQGSHSVLVRSECAAQNWGFRFHPLPSSDTTRWEEPCPVKGLSTPWLYLGPVPGSITETPAKLQTLYRLFDWSGSGGKEAVYWRADQPHTWIRPYLENRLFGKWNYPLGVTLYGLLQAARTASRPDLLRYVQAHIDECIRMHRYALWDRDTYGYPAINQQLVELDALDDCGSFGSAMLECSGSELSHTARETADIIAEYIANGQERTPQGAFFRKSSNTLWIDDLYMSTPFMIRYARLAGKPELLEDAVRQFGLYRSYLAMEEHGIMSHVYDFHYSSPTLVPWGRGNGWCAFSLSEVLEALPLNHPEREEAIRFFQWLCKGYLRLQGAQGLWHQVLTDPSSYEETSCTAMFVYAFARGVRHGWLENTDAFAAAAERGWAGLARCSIDEYGDVHGVCRGSSYSFSPAYYKDDLLWITNDTHGIGIVLLAGVEISKLRTWRKEHGNGQ